MKSYIWDTGPISLYFSGHNPTIQLMNECFTSNVKGFVPMIILSELYYLQWREYGARLARMRLESIINSSLETLSLDENAIFKVGEMKVKHPELSLADAVLVALSKNSNSTILTTDNPLTKIKGIKSKKIDY
jgi:predicted nucleic acid-binding protein